MDFIKRILPIKTKIDGKFYSCHIDIKFKDGKLSISGVVGAKRNGDCVGSCGQIIDELTNLKVDEYNLNDGFTLSDIKKLHDIWQEWHLNDMQAGTPKQELFLKEWKLNNRYDYTLACKALEENNLYIDNGYKYGSAWLRKEVPTDVIEWLYNLEDTKTVCKWSL